MSMFPPDEGIAAQLSYDASLWPEATSGARGMMPAADKAAMDYARGTGIIVATYHRTLFPLAGEAQYANATTGWTAFGSQAITDVHTGLPTVASGATRRYRWVVTYNLYSTTGTGTGTVWLMGGGAPGVGTVRHAINNLAHTGNNVATKLAVRYTTYSGGNAPYSDSAPAGDTPVWYGQGPTGGGTLWVSGIELITEDYIP